MAPNINSLTDFDVSAGFQDMMHATALGITAHRSDTEILEVISITLRDLQASYYSGRLSREQLRPGYTVTMNRPKPAKSTRKDEPTSLPELSDGAEVRAQDTVMGEKNLENVELPTTFQGVASEHKVPSDGRHPSTPISPKPNTSMTDDKLKVEKPNRIQKYTPKRQQGYLAKHLDKIRAAAKASQAPPKWSEKNTKVFAENSEYLTAFKLIDQCFALPKSTSLGLLKFNEMMEKAGPGAYDVASACIKFLKYKDNFQPQKVNGLKPKKST